MARGSGEGVRKYHALPTFQVFHNVPLGLYEYMGVRGPVGCLPGWTEVMTPDGWRRIDSWRDGDELLEWDRETGECAFRVPVRKIVGECGKMLEMSCGRRFSMTVTENHRVPLYDWRGKFVVKSAAAVASRPSRHVVPTSWSGNGGLEGWEDDDLRLWVAIAADGYYPKRGRQCVFCLRKARKVERLEWLLGRCGASYSKRMRVRRDGSREVVVSFARPSHPKHLDWRLSRCSGRQAAVVVDETRYWDGLFDGGEDRFYSTDARDADIVQFLAHSCGRRANVVTAHDGRNEAWRDVSTVYISRPGSPKGKVMLRCDGFSVREVVPEDGKQYCFETHSGFFVVRQNGRIFVTGNSGKSVGMCWHIRTMAETQPAMRVRQKMSDRQYHGEKIRWSKWLIGRQTYKQLTEGTIPTWVREFPDTHITWSGAPHGYLFMPSMANDGTWVWIDLQFIAFESPTADDDLQGMEFSGVWVNEACQVPWHLIWRANTRVGRFQPFLKSEGVALKKFGVIMDTNSPNESNWWKKKEQDEKPDRMLWFIQPPALIKITGKDGKPEYLDNNEENARKYGIRPAENVGGHDDGFHYWRKMTIGGDEDDIRRLVLNEYGTSVAGKPIYPDFNPSMHVREGLEFMPGLPLYLGTDFGLTPAMVFMQIGRDGVIRVLDELVSEDMTLDTFISSMVRPRLAERFGWPHSCRSLMNYCDPAGLQRMQTYGDTCMDLLRANGIPTEPCPDITNDFRTRRDAVSRQLKRLEASGAGFLVDKRCEVLIKGFNGHYCYKKLRTGGDSAERYAEGPDKSDFYTHVQDALQYAVLGATRCGLQGSGYGGATQVMQSPQTRTFDFGCA